MKINHSIQRIINKLLYFYLPNILSELNNTFNLAHDFYAMFVHNILTIATISKLFLFTTYTQTRNKKHPSYNHKQTHVSKKEPSIQRT